VGVRREAYAGLIGMCAQSRDGRSGRLVDYDRFGPITLEHPLPMPGQVCPVAVVQGSDPHAGQVESEQASVAISERARHDEFASSANVILTRDPKAASRWGREHEAVEHVEPSASAGNPPRV